MSTQSGVNSHPAQFLAAHFMSWALAKSVRLDLDSASVVLLSALKVFDGSFVLLGGSSGSKCSKIAQFTRLLIFLFRIESEGS